MRTTAQAQPLKVQALEAELAETQHHLEEASMWHYARVAARGTTRELLALPPETQEIAMLQRQFGDNECIMVAEFLINNLMIVSCDLSRNHIGSKGATALAQVHFLPLFYSRSTLLDY